MLRLGLALVSLLIPILSVACSGTPSAVPKDAKGFAVLLATKAGEGDWKTIQRLLVPEFQGYREDALQRALSIGGSVSDTVWHSFSDPNQWQEERHPEFTIVRVSKFPLMALVLRQSSGGEWRLDPGPYALALAGVLQKAGPPPASVNLSETAPRNVRREIQTSANQLQVVRRFSDELVNVAVQGENIKLTWQVTLIHVSEARVPLTGLSWRAGDKSGTAPVVWTTAMIEDDALVFPGAGSEASVHYLVTLGLEGVPEAEAVELVVKDIVMDGMALSVAYSFEPNNL